jgi:hypothetical protein
MAMNSMMLAQLMKDMQVGLSLKRTHTTARYDFVVDDRRPSSDIYFEGTLTKKAMILLSRRTVQS